MDIKIKVFNYLIDTIVENSKNNKAIITNVDLWAVSWKDEMSINIELDINNYDIKQLKKELHLSNTKIAEFFDLNPTSFANSTAKSRYENALCRFWKYAKEHERKENYL